MAEDMTDSQPSRFRTRWKLALGVMVLFAASVGWFFAWPVYQRHCAIEAIKRAGGAIGGERHGPQWLERLGINTSRVVVLNLEGSGISDEGMYHFSGLSHLEHLLLSGTDIGDDGVLHVSHMASLETLVLKNTGVTDAGLTQCDGMTGLKNLSLTNTAVSDEGLKYLVTLKNLEWLHLGGTQVSSEGMDVLRKALPNCNVER